MTATPLVLVGCRIFADGFDLTGYSNKIEVNSEVEERDVTTFLPTSDADCGWKKVKGGIASATITGGGLWEAAAPGATAGAVDDFAFPALGTTIPMSIYPSDADEGSLGYFTSVLDTSYTFLGSIGDAAPWNVKDSSAWPLVRGASLQAPGTARTTTGTGTAVQLGAVPAGKQLYAALHVLSVAGTAGPTLTVKVQSDNANGFPHAADQITFSAATVADGQIARVAGPITDDWFRVSYTISGTNPSFLFVVTAGISV